MTCGLGMKEMNFAPIPLTVSLYFPTPWPALQMSWFGCHGFVVTVADGWPYSINLLLGRQLLGNLIRLLQVFQITLDPVYLADITILLQLFCRFFGVLFLLG